VHCAAQVERFAEHGESLDQHPGAEIDFVHDASDHVQSSVHPATIDHFGDQPQGVRAHVRSDARHGAVHLVGHILEALHGIRTGDDGGERVALPDMVGGPFTVISHLDPPPERPNH